MYVGFAWGEIGAEVQKEGMAKKKKKKKEGMASLCPGPSTSSK